MVATAAGDVTGNKLHLTERDSAPVPTRAPAITAAALAVAGIVGATVPAVAFARPTASVVSFEEERIEFDSGSDNAIRSGYVLPDYGDRWILRAAAGQVMDLTVNSADDNTVFTVFASGHVRLPMEAQGRMFSGTLTEDGDYTVEVESVDGFAYYQLKVWIDAAVRDPLGSVQRLAFAPGSDTAIADGAVVRGSADTWVLGAAAGQTMDVSVVAVQDNATFEVFAPHDVALTAPDDRTVWRGQLTQDGDYHVVVEPTFGNATYTITGRVTGGTAIRRISFPPGTDNLTITDDIGPGETHRWIAAAAAGQTMQVSLQSSDFEVFFNIYGPDGALGGERRNAGPGELTESGDYIIDVMNTGGSSSTYTLTVVIT